MPDLVLCSNARRATETAAILQATLGFSDEQLELKDDLYLASPATILDILSEVPPTLGHIMVIAHNPGLEDLSEYLAGRSLPPMPTLGIRHFVCKSIGLLKHWTTSHASMPDTPNSPATLVFDDFPKNI